MNKAKDVDSYIANSGREARPKLNEIREIIHSTIPKVEEGISWGVPFYKYHGALAGFAVYKNHVSVGIAAAELQPKDREMLEKRGYITGKKTIQIKFDQKVPTAAIKHILKVKAKMNEAKRANKTMKKPGINQSKSPAQLITQRIAELGDWRGETLAHVRKLIKEADPKVTEEVLWRKPSNPGGVPVWSDSGIVCTGESYKTHVKITFAKGASIKDPKGIFNSSLDGNARRAIDLYEGDKINESAFKELIRAAVKLNSKGKK